jgi:hypothetical protein
MTGSVRMVDLAHETPVARGPMAAIQELKGALDQVGVASHIAPALVRGLGVLWVAASGAETARSILDKRGDRDVEVLTAIAANNEFCPQCGAELEARDVYCRKCGAFTGETAR